MLRITADLIVNSRAFYNPMKERQIDLRGNRVLVIENLGAMEDQFDVLDLSDNEVKKLSNFPVMRRLKTALFSNNHISTIDASISTQLLSLQYLMLTNNRITDLGQIDHLSGFAQLQHLSLVDNPVTRRPNYRLYTIHKLPSVKVLDFRKVKQKERQEAAELFASKDGMEIEDQVVAAKTAPPKKKQGPTPEQLEAFRLAIANASSPEELDKLERMGRAGVFDLKAFQSS